MLSPLLAPLFTVCISYAQIMNHKIGVNLCKVMCMERRSCERVAYDARTLTCQLLSRSTEQQLEKDYITFPKGKHIPFTGACSLKTCVSNTRCLENHRGRAVCVHDTPVSMLKKRCKRNEECASINLLCVRRRCQCAVGFSFNPADNTCVKRCKAYGHRSTFHKGYSIGNINKGNIKSHKVSSFSACAQKCYKETKFTCISFQYWTLLHVCEVYDVGWFDASPSQRFRKARYTRFGIRDCA